MSLYLSVSGRVTEGSNPIKSIFINDQDWMIFGNCAAIGGQAWDHLTEGEQKIMCSSCPVKAKCLDYAIDSESIGTWGGHIITDKNGTPDNIRDMRKGHTYKPWGHEEDAPLIESEEESA